MRKGVYCLIFHNSACNIRIGRLGEVNFTPGWHIYVGSALGTGGLQRVRRHVQVNRHKNFPPHWHVDFFSCHPDVVLRYVICAETEDQLECTLAEAIGGGYVRGFGCSDCSCPSHLFHRADNPVSEIESTFRKVHLNATIQRINTR